MTLKRRGNNGLILRNSNPRAKFPQGDVPDSRVEVILTSGHAKH
jgi:hypothetical protein